MRAQPADGAPVSFLEQVLSFSSDCTQDCCIEGWPTLKDSLRDLAIGRRRPRVAAAGGLRRRASPFATHPPCPPPPYVLGSVDALARAVHPRHGDFICFAAAKKRAPG